MNKPAPDGEVAFEPGVSGFVNHAHAPFADLFENFKYTLVFIGEMFFACQPQINIYLPKRETTQFVILFEFMNDF